jgi:hypothetical protein
MLQTYTYQEVSSGLFWLDIIRIGLNMLNVAIFVYL